MIDFDDVIKTVARRTTDVAEDAIKTRIKIMGRVFVWNKTMDMTLGKVKAATRGATEFVIDRILNDVFDSFKRDVR